MLTARHHAASAIVNEEIYVIGGRITGSLVNVDIVEKYDPKLDKWTTDFDPMPSKRSGIGAVSIDGLIYVLGGEQNQGTFNNNERYDPVSDTWSIEMPMPTARHGLGVASIDDKIFAVGGGPHPGLTVTGQNEIYFLNNG
jgi:N-acetylneuraminic acid mutarotase